MGPNFFFCFDIFLFLSFFLSSNVDYIRVAGVRMLCLSYPVPGLMAWHWIVYSLYDTAFTMYTHVRVSVLGLSCLTTELVSTSMNEETEKRTHTAEAVPLAADIYPICL